MTYLTIDTKTKKAKKFVAQIKNLPFVKVLNHPNSITKKAIGDARKGKTRKAASLKLLFSDLKK